MEKYYLLKTEDTLKDLNTTENGLSSAEAEKRLKENSFGYPVKHIAFEYIGHEMLVSLSPIYKIAFKAERKYKTECKDERKRLAYELLNWVKNQWK